MVFSIREMKKKRLKGKSNIWYNSILLLFSAKVSINPSKMHNKKIIIKDTLQTLGSCENQMYFIKKFFMEPHNLEYLGRDFKLYFWFVVSLIRSPQCLHFFASFWISSAQ